MLVNGVDVEYQGQDGETVYDKVWLFDFAKPEEIRFPCGQPVYHYREWEQTGVLILFFC